MTTTYCDEFSFDEVFEDHSFIEIKVEKMVTTRKDFNDDSNKENNEECGQYLNTSEFKYYAKKEELEFITKSMTEEEQDTFWGENMRIKNNAIACCDSEEEEDTDFNEEDFYFQRDVLSL
jgi:hypothetical protein